MNSANNDNTIPTDPHVAGDISMGIPLENVGPMPDSLVKKMSDDFAKQGDVYNQESYQPTEAEITAIKRAKEGIFEKITKLLK